MADGTDEVDDKPVVTAEASPSAAPASAPPAETAPPPATGPTVDDLLVKPADQRAIQDRLVEIKRNQMAETSAGTSEVIKRLRADRAEMDAAYRAAAPPLEDLKPWDQKAKQNEYRTDPVEAFGSLGSVFAMLAPAFAGLPMEYALNAGASAINAVHAQDEKAYQRDYTSWKDNTELAIKRHNIMRQSYNDSILKMNTNLNAGRSELELNARKYGDQQALALLEAGLDGDLMKLIDARNKSALELQSTANKVWLEHEKVNDLKNDPAYYVPATRAKAIEDWQKRWAPQGVRQLAYDAERDFVEKWKAENPDWTATSLQEAVAGFRKSSAEAEGAGGSTGVMTPGRMEAAEIQRRKAKYIEDGMDPTEAHDRATKEVKRVSLTQSGNRVADDRSLVDQIEVAKKLLDENDALLKKYIGIAGTPGYLGRAGERVGNIFGSNQTDRSAFESNVEKLKLIGPRLLTLSRGRPLAAEAQRIDSIFKGKGYGDMRENTLRGNQDVRKMMQEMQNNLVRQLDDTWTPPAQRPAGGGSPAKPGGVKPWERDKIIAPAAPGPRSSLDGATMSDADPEGVEAGTQYAMMPPVAVEKPRMVQPATPQERLQQGVDELDDIAEQLSPRMYNKLISYARTLAPRAGGPR